MAFLFMTTTKEKLDRLEMEMTRGKDISITNLVDYFIESAHRSRVSDIHIDPLVGKIIVRFRIDGILREMYSFPKSLHGEIISRIKVLSGMRTDEHQTAQDGRFRYIFSDQGVVDLRVSILPTYHGENAVLRLLSDKAENFSLKDLGFREEERKKIITALKKPNGMILATGPTGSGKTTTLYTMLKMLKSPEISIITIEDPIEYAIEEVKQIQVNARTGLSFANGLRSILRQDPNIIMVGEIRDSETANISVNTALTGHLLLSTLHTNDAATTLPRLLDMGIEEYLVASTVSIAISQRLVRKICPDCKENLEMNESARESLAKTALVKMIKKDQKIFRGKGCDKCNQSGYVGRVAINEVLVADNVIREAILRKASAAELRNIATKHGMKTMLEDGFSKAEEGLTTIEEILRVTHE